MVCKLLLKNQRKRKKEFLNVHFSKNVIAEY